VGKSTLFNRLVGRREAIVADAPGTTRDRLFATITWDDRSIILVDTGGLEVRPDDALIKKVKEQVELAMREADVVIFLLDAIDGLTPADHDIAQQLRRLRKPLVLAVNKVDNTGRSLTAQEFHALGLGDPVLVSAYHNSGIHDLMERVLSLLPQEASQPEAAGQPMRLAIIGRPNVGKSALLNAILGEERAIVSEQPGTTRDALDTAFSYKGQPVVLIDTAGMRRRGRIDVGIERYSVLRAYRAMERADIVALVLDTTEMVAAQDAHIAGLAWEDMKGIIVVVNKWDLASELGAERKEAERIVRETLHFMSYSPVVFTSALKKTGIGTLMDTAISLHQERCKRIDADELHRVILEVISGHPLPKDNRRSLRVYEVAQDGINPPTFRFTVNDPNLIHFSYQRYLENQLRLRLEFPRTHIRLSFQAKGKR
jgi:GTP-binding protein